MFPTFYWSHAKLSRSYGMGGRGLFAKVKELCSNCLLSYNACTNQREHNFDLYIFFYDLRGIAV